MSEFTEQRVVLTLPGMNCVEKRSVVFASRDSVDLILDAYYPATSDQAHPAVVFVSGYPDPGFERAVGCRFKDLGFYVSWAHLVACSDMVAITYENLDPVPDANTVIDYVAGHAAQLNIDPGRIGIWGSSGNGPTALSLLAGSAVQARCAALSYSYLMDLDGDTTITDAAAQWGFADPLHGASFSDLQPVPLMLLRAGLDEMPGLNRSLDRFVGKALEDNYPVTLINHAQGQHAFDQTDDSALSRRYVRSTLKFLRQNLGLEE